MTTPPQAPPQPDLDEVMRALARVEEGQRQMREEFQEGQRQMREEFQEGLREVREDSREFRRETREDLRNIHQRIDDTQKRIDRLFYTIIGIGGAALAALIGVLITFILRS